MAKQLRPSQLEALLSSDLNGNEFFAVHRVGYNYSLTVGELKKYIGTGGSGGGSDIDLTSVPSNIIPDSNGSRILGNAENAWQRLFLTDSIRFINNGIIYGNVDVQGALTLNGQALAMQSSITNIAGIVNDIDNRLEKVEIAGGVDLSDYYTKKNVDEILKDYLPYIPIDSAPTAGSSNLVTSGGVLSTIAALDEYSEATYLKKNSSIELGTNAITGNGGANIVDSVGQWVILGSGVAAKGWPTYIDGNEIYLRYGTGHTTRMKISSAGTDIYGGLGVSGGIYSGSNVFSYASGDGLYMSDYSINAHNKGMYTRQLLKFDSSSGKVNLVNGFETNVTSYIGSADNTDYKALLLRRSGKGLRITMTSDRGYIAFGSLNAAKDELTSLNSIVTIGTDGLKYSPNDVNYYDILTSNSLKIGEYAFQDRTENRLSSTTDLNNVSYGVWGTLDNTTYTNAPIQNFGLIVSRLNQLYKGQLLLPYSSGNLYYRAQLYNNGKIDWSAWRKLAFTDDIPSVAGFLKEGFSISNATITTLTTSTIKYTGGTSSAYWELNNQGGGGGNSPAFTKNLKIKENNTFYENVHAGNISQYAITDISGKQDTISDLAAIRSNAANGNTAYNWGDHSGQGYALKYNFMSFDGVLAADDNSILPYLRTSSPSYGYISSIANMTIRYCKSSNFNSGYGAFFAFDLTALQTAAMQGNYGSVPIYYAFPNSDYYNDFNNNRTYAVAKSYKLFGNSTELYGNHTAGLYKLIHEGNIETILSGKYLGKNDTAAAANRLVSNSGSHVLYVDSNGYPTSNNILLFKNAAGSSNFGYVGRANDTGLYVMTYGSSPIIFGTNSAERFRVDYNGNILIANDKMILFNHTNEGVYMYGTGISWHNSSNAWTKSLMTFSNTGVVNFPNSATIGGNDIIHADNISDYALPKAGGTVDHITTSMLNGYSLKGTSSGLTLSGYFSATRFYEDGTSLAEKYLSKSSDTVTGTLTFNGTSTYHLREASTTPKWYIGKDGYATFAYVTNISDANMKNLMGDVNLSVSQIANAPAKYFTWNNNIQLGRQVGTVAQYWREVLPEVVMENEGILGLNYASLAVVSAIVLARNIETHEQRIARLEKEIATLTDELNSLVGKA